MKVIIAGSRGITGQRALDLIMEAVVEAEFPITEIVSGGANGVDTAAYEYAKRNQIDCRILFAKWDRHGKAYRYTH